MPIRPENKHHYAKSWCELSLAIRSIRAGWRCEWVENGKRCEARQGEPNPVTGAKVVLTVAHLDHNPENNDVNNLMAMCQLHHNRYDAKHRAENRCKNKKEKEEQSCKP